MRAHDARPRIACGDVQQFSEWMEGRGWVCTGWDSDSHTTWAHPSGGQHKLPGTPSAFNVRRARAEVIRKEGLDPGGLVGKRRSGRVKEREAQRRKREARRLAERQAKAAREAEEVAALAAVAREARAVELHEKELHEVAVALEYAREAYRLDRSNAGKRLYLARLTQQYEQMTKGVTR